MGPGASASVEPLVGLVDTARGTAVGGTPHSASYRFLAESTSWAFKSADAVFPVADAIAASNWRDNSAQRWALASGVGVDGAAAGPHDVKSKREALIVRSMLRMKEPPTAPSRGVHFNV